jgi:two-component system, cell cycle sensor histidine kinase and response regulator CckA
MMAQAQRSSQNPLTILDRLPDAYARIDSKCRFTFVNKSLEQLLVKPRKALLGKTPWEVLPSGEGASLEANFRRVMAERRTLTFEAPGRVACSGFVITAMPDRGRGIIARFADQSGLPLDDALRKSEEKFSRAFLSSPIPMCIVNVDQNARFLELNTAFERITGYQRDEVIGRTSTELRLYWDPWDLAESRRKLLTEGGYHNLEIRFRQKSGAMIVGLVSAEPIEINGALCAISAAIDVTEQRRTEQALRESEELYRHLFEVESDALVLVDNESGSILAANAAAARLYGYTREELLSKNRVDLSAEPQETIRATLERRQFIPLRWHKKKDDTVFPVEISGTYFDSKQRPVFISAIRDITERKLMEDALRKSEEKFAKAFQSNPAAITITDLESGNYLDANDSFQEMTGYSRKEVIGRNWNDLCIWIDCVQRDERVQDLVREGKLRSCEFQFRRKNGSLATGLLFADLLEIQGRSCAVTAAIDITERLQLESRLRQAQKLESIGRLAGGVAHDFNNLLTIINGYSDLILRESKPGGSVYRHAEEIQKAGNNAASLTGQLLAFGRKQVVELRRLDINNVVHDIEQMLRRLIREDVQFISKLDPQLGSVMADPHQMNQVIMNLVVNARDAMPEGGMLTIATSNVDFDEAAIAFHPDAAPGRFVMIDVADTGAGMTQETMQNIYEPFFTTKARGAGTGLGLSTVYGIVHQCNGWIEVSSELGRGAEFRVYLPRVDAASVPNEPETTAPGPRGGEETVLLVEDNAEVRTYTAGVLGSSGYHVLEAADGAAALTLVRGYKGDIDVLVTDVIMPGMSGKDLADRIRDLRPKLLVLFISGYTADVLARRGVLQEDVAYLPKPFSADSLVAKIRELLSKPATPQRAAS